MMTSSDDHRLDPTTWVDLHGDVMYRYALARVRSPDAAADLVQEAFLQALRVREGFQGRSSERTWLIGILRHKILDRYRQASRRPEAVESGDFFDDGGFWRKGPSRWPDDPGDEAEKTEFWEHFEVCRHRLPAGLAAAFTLRELDQMGSDEICEVLAITPANLWARLHRARLLLRACLENSWFGGNAR